MRLLGKLTLATGVASSALVFSHYYSKWSFYDPEVRSELRKALLADKQNQPKLAEAHFHSALHSTNQQHGPDSKQTFYLLLQMADHYRTRGDLEQAFRIYKHLEEKIIQNVCTEQAAEIFKAAGDVLADAGGPEEAIQHYEEALKRAPRDNQRGPILESIGVAQVKIGDSEAALQSFQTALKLCKRLEGVDSPNCKAIADSIHALRII